MSKALFNITDIDFKIIKHIASGTVNSCTH